MNSDRRRLLLAALPACAVSCLAQTPKHKFQNPADMTWEQVFQFAYSRLTIPLYKALCEEAGKEKGLAMLQNAGDATARARLSGFKLPMEQRNIAFIANVHTGDSIGMGKFLTSHVVERSEKAFEMKVTECLWAKVFREANAADIGYAVICHGDYAEAAAFNPKIPLVRTKTLMQGHDCCNPRYESD